MSTVQYATQQSAGIRLAARLCMDLGHGYSWSVAVNPHVPEFGTNWITTKRSTRLLGVQPT
jgi:hypothetical protein